MIEFREIERNLGADGKIIKSYSVLQYRHLVPFRAASGDILLCDQWTDWMDVKNDPLVTPTPEGAESRTNKWVNCPGLS